jgi:hypothetical protein
LACKPFRAHPVVHLGEVGQVGPIFVHLEIVLISAQYRCTVCDEHTIGSEIILDTLDGTHR